MSRPLHHPARPGRTHRRAFSLIEAIAALVIAAVALPALLWSIRDAQQRRSGPVMFERARWLAAEQLEDILADRWSAERGYAFVVTANYPAEPSLPGYPGFGRSVEITETDAALSGPGAGQKLVRVTVTWPGSSGGVSAFELTSVIADDAP